MSVKAVKGVEHAAGSAAPVALPAQVLAAQGKRSVIPVRGDKKPAAKWAKWQHERPPLSQLEQWRNNIRPPLWAVVTGAVSGTIVLDFDGEAGLALAKQLGLQPNVISASGGWHVYVRHPGHPVKTRTKILPSLDVRGDGGYAVFHGETERGRYQLLNPEPQLTVAQLPDEIATLLVDGPSPPLLAEPAPAPAPVVLSDDRAELRRLWAMHRKGEVHPEHVPLPALWRNPSRAEQALYELLQVRFGLLVRDGRSEPLMLATSEVVREGIVVTRAGASKLLHRFEAEHIVWSPGEMPAQGKGNGTRLFLPGRKPGGPAPPGGWRITLDSDGVPVAGFEPGAVAVEAQHVEARLAVEPAPEAVDEPLVRDAVGRRPVEPLDGVVAVRNSTELVVARSHATGRYAGRPTPQQLLDQALSAVAVGTRNEKGHWLAQQVRWNGHGDDEVWRVLLAYQRAVEDHGDHSYTVQEAQATVQSALRQRMREPYGLPARGPKAAS